MIRKNIVIWFLILISFQTATLIFLNSSITAHFSFSIFLTSVFLSIVFFNAKGYAPLYLHPFFILSLTFALHYWLSPLIYALFPPVESSYLFSFSPDDSIFPQLIALTSYIGFAITVYIINFFVKPATIKRELILKKISFNKIKIAILFYIFLILSKFYFFSQGWMHSVIGFVDSSPKPLYFEIIRPFIPISIFIFCFLFFYTKEKTRSRYILILIFLADILLSLAMGDRRILIGYLMSAIALKYYKGEFRFRFIRLFSLLIILLLYYGFSTKINIELDKKVFYGKDITYPQVFSEGVKEFASDPLNGFEKSTVIISSFIQTQMIDAAIKARKLEYKYESSPLEIFLFGVIPGSNSLGLSTRDGNYLQLPMYENALHYQTLPNLTNPLPGEHFIHDGWFGVLYASIFSATLMMLFYKISSINMVTWLWYWSFFNSNSMGFAMSLTRDVTYSIKSLIFIIILYSISKILFKKSIFK